MSFEDWYLNKIFEEEPGRSLERILLGKVDDNKYVIETRKILLEKLAIEDLKSAKKMSDPIGALNNLKARNKEAYQDLIERIKPKVDKILEEKVKQGRHSHIYELSIDDLFLITERSQPKNSTPDDAFTSFANDLQATIAYELGIDFEEIEYYSAVGSHLDYMGADAFFKFKQKNGKDIRVCLDVTMNTAAGKREQQKGKRIYLADVVGYFDKEGYDRKKDAENLKSIASKIIEEYKSKKNNIN